MALKEKKTRIEVEYRFTEAEKLDLGKKLSQQQIEIEGAEEAKKNTTAELSSLIKIMKTKRMKMAHELNQGFQHRMVDVNLVVDLEGKKRRYYDLKTGEIIRETGLEPEDEQTTFDFPEGVEDDGDPFENDTMDEEK